MIQEYNRGPGLFRYGNAYQSFAKRAQLMLELYGIKLIR